MSPEFRPNRRAMYVLAGCALITVGVFWWSSGGPLAPVPNLPVNSPPTASDPGSVRGANPQTTVPDFDSPPVDDDSSAHPITMMELQTVHVYIFEARMLLRQIESKHAKSVLVTDNETERTEYVFLPALTREQLDPVYTQLSKSVKQFPARGAAAKLFREEVSKFLQTLPKLPARVANQIVNKETDLSSYGSMRLSEDATVTVGEHGSLEIHGSAVSGFQPVRRGEVSHLFRDESNSVEANGGQ